jgi:hypothetical protein
MKAQEIAFAANYFGQFGENPTTTLRSEYCKERRWT